MFLWIYSRDLDQNIASGWNNLKKMFLYKVILQFLWQVSFSVEEELITKHYKNNYCVDDKKQI